MISIYSPWKSCILIFRKHYILICRLH